MRRAADSKGAGGVRKSRRKTIKAPIGGLNARDPSAAMPPLDATTLENFFPTQTSVERRKSCSYYASGTGTIRTIIEYGGLSANKLFLGAVNGSTYTLFERSTSGTWSSVVVGGAGATVQALTSVTFDYINVGTTGGQFLLLCNGADPMLEYDGTTWSVGAITGVTGGTDEISSIALYNERVWLMRKNTFEVWYLSIGAKSGAATVLNLGIFFKAGGSLASIITMSIDSASDLADHIGFLSTKGELVVFRGNVADAASWTRVSQVTMGRPIGGGQRCWTKLGADALILCVDGVFPITKAILSDRSELRYSLSEKISPLIRDALSYSGDFGWQIVYFPVGRKLIVNVPTSLYPDGYQFVMNTETKAWCVFTGFNAQCFGTLGDSLLFGSAGWVHYAESGETANDFFEGAHRKVTAFGRQAPDAFGSPSEIKHFKMIRVNGVKPTAYYVELTAGINEDFSSYAPTDMVLQRTDAPTLANIGDWMSAPVSGYFGAVAVSVVGQTASESTGYEWTSTDVAYELGEGI